MKERRDKKAKIRKKDKKTKIFPHFQNHTVLK